MFNATFRLYAVTLLTLAGTAAGAQDQARPTSGIPHIVITRDEIQRQNIRRLDQLFDGQIPGIVAVDRGASQTTSMRSRGMSSATVVAQPRIYLNEAPLDAAASLSQIAVESVDSVVAEIGAVAGTLLGAGATGGVVRIYTKRGRANTSLRVTGKTSAGFDRSLYNDESISFQDHNVELESGRKWFTFYAGGGHGSEGDWAPAYRDRVNHASSTFTAYSRIGTLTLHGRLNDRKYSVADLRSGRRFLPEARTNDLVHSNYGAATTLNFTSWWHGEVFYGFHKSDEASRQEGPRALAPSDTLLTNDFLETRRTSIIYSTSISLPRYGRISPYVSATYDQSELVTETRDETVLGGSPFSLFSTRSERRWEGFAAKLGLLIGQRFVLNTGVRRDAKDGGIVRSIENPKFRPRYDAAYTFAGSKRRATSLTVRAARGESTNPVLVHPLGEITPTYMVLPSPGLLPERLRGTEAGFDLNFSAGRISTTLFEQIGRGGHRRVLVELLVPAGGGPSYPVYQDVAAIDVKTRGVSSSLRLANGPLLLTADYTAYHSEDKKVDSRVTGYTPRSSINDFPTQNGHASVQYVDELGSLNLDARYVGGHREWDYSAVTSSGFPTARNIHYPGFATYDFNMSKPIRGYGTVIVFVHNIANTERYGVNNRDFIYGRRVGLGLRLDK